MNTRTDEQRAQITLCDRVITCELSNDYTLPDYQPEIRRVLRVSATVLPASKYVSGSRAELGGAVDYRLLYVASDGKLYCAPLASEYSLSVPLEMPSNVDLGEGVILLCDATAESASARVSGPRRVSVRSKINARLRAYATAVIDELASGECKAESIERLIGQTRCQYICSGIGETQELSTDISTASDGARVIDASADLIISELTPLDSLAECRGEAVIRLLVCDENEGGEPKLIVHKLPFEDKIELDRLTGECECTACGYVNDLKVTVEENGILCVVNAYAEVTAYGEEKLSYTKDLYSTENYSECSHKAITIPTKIACVSSSLSQSERIGLSEGATAIGADAISCACEASVDSCSYDDGKCALTGQCRYSVIAKKEGEYFCFEEIVPLRYEFASSAPHCTYNARVLPKSSSARIDGNTLALDAELSVTVELSGGNEITTLSEVRFGEPITERTSDMIICYPSPEDTLWSISKRYAVPKLSAEGVSDPEDKLDEVKYLIVNF